MHFTLSGTFRVIWCTTHGYTYDVKAHNGYKKNDAFGFGASRFHCLGFFFADPLWSCNETIDGLWVLEKDGHKKYIFTHTHTIIRDVHQFSSTCTQLIFFFCFWIIFFFCTVSSNGFKIQLHFALVAWTIYKARNKHNSIIQCPMAS